RIGTEVARRGKRRIECSDPGSGGERPLGETRIVIVRKVLVWSIGLGLAVATAAAQQAPPRPGGAARPEARREAGEPRRERAEPRREAREEWREERRGARDDRVEQRREA